jgi:hypothetical protein
VLTKHRLEPLMEQCHLLRIGVRAVGVIRREVVETLVVLVDTPRSLLQVQELLNLVSHESRRYVVSTKGLPKLDQRTRWLS